MTLRFLASLFIATGIAISSWAVWEFMQPDAPALVAEVENIEVPGAIAGGVEIPVVIRLTNRSWRAVHVIGLPVC